MTHTEYREPLTHQEGLSALKLRRGKGIVRRVHWNHIKTRQAFPEYPINVGPDNTLYIVVWSGIPKLIVESGHVEIRFLSSWGNSLDIREGASAHVVTDSRTKVTIDNSGTLTIDAPEKNRIYASGGSICGPDGNRTDRVRRSSLSEIQKAERG